MPKVKIYLEGLYEFRNAMWATAQQATTIGARAVYEGAGVAADALRGAVEGLQRVSDKAAMGAWRKHEPTWISVSQKNGLREGLGIAPMRFETGSINTKVGFDGYNSVVTKRWPNGQPNQVIAAVCNHGSSDTMLRQPFITSTAAASAGEIRAAMRKAASEEIRKILDENM